MAVYAIEFHGGSEKPRALAVCRGSRGSELPAMAPEPSGLANRLSTHLSRYQRSESNMQHQARASLPATIGWARCRCVYAGITTVALRSARPM